MNLHVSLTDHFVANKRGTKLAAQLLGEAVAEMKDSGAFFEEGKELFIWCLMMRYTNAIS